MTQYLIANGPLFIRVAAGISNITSYWGEDTGGTPSAGASAGNYLGITGLIEVEPLFHADKIETPLLLLHGQPV